MMHSAKILLDSISPAGARLTTMEVVFPRIVLAEFNTHRAFSRNSASSRAIPVAKMLDAVRTNPYVPTHWGANQPGMVAKYQVDIQVRLAAKRHWLQARDYAVEQVERLMACNIHKQVANRLLEPFLWHTVIVSATEWSNFFQQRCAADAHPDIRAVAVLMRDALEASVPLERTTHAPLLPDFAELEAADYDHDQRCMISIARCARVSYLTHDGVRDPQKDLELFYRLKNSRHWSPLEHVARAVHDPAARYGNFSGWMQYRQMLESK